MSLAGGELGYGPGEGHGAAVPAGDNCKGSSSTVSVGNKEKRSRSRVEVGVVVGGEGNDSLIEHHMVRYEDPTRGKVKASVTLMFRGVPEEETESRPRSQLVGSGGGGVRVTRTPEDSKVIIPTRGTKKSMMWCGSCTGSGRKTVKEIGGVCKLLAQK